MLLKSNLFIQFRTYDLALQACLGLKVELNQSGDLYSSDFFIKYFILRVLTLHSRFWNANIVWMGWCTDWFFWVLFHVFCFESTSLFAGFPVFWDHFLWGDALISEWGNIRWTSEHFLPSCALVGAVCAMQTELPQKSIVWRFYEAMDSISLH